MTKPKPVKWWGVEWQSYDGMWNLLLVEEQRKTAIDKATVWRVIGAPGFKYRTRPVLVTPIERKKKP
jgi:hypothetical protein